MPTTKILLLETEKRKFLKKLLTKQQHPWLQFRKWIHWFPLFTWFWIQYYKKHICSKIVERFFLSLDTIKQRKTNTTCLFPSSVIRREHIFIICCLLGMKTKEACHFISLVNFNFDLIFFFFLQSLFYKSRQCKSIYWSML